MKGVKMKKEECYISEKKLKIMARCKSFDEIERELEITEISMERGRHGYPNSKYYKLDTEVHIEKKQKAIKRFFEKYEGIKEK